MIWFWLCLGSITVTALAVLYVLSKQTLIDRCGVEVIAPEDLRALSRPVSLTESADLTMGRALSEPTNLMGEKSEGPTPSKVRLSAETTRDSQRMPRAQAKPECALDFDCGPDVAGSNAASIPSALSPEGAKKWGTAGRDRQYLILAQLLASGALRKI